MLTMIDRVLRWSLDDDLDNQKGPPGSFPGASKLMGARQKQTIKFNRDPTSIWILYRYTEFRKRVISWVKM